MLLWYANISIAVARPWRNSQIRPVNVPFEESGSPCSAAERDKLEAAVLDVAQQTGTRLFYRLAPTLLPGFTMFELTVGEATLDLSGKEIVALFEMLLRQENT